MKKMSMSEAGKLGYIASKEIFEKRKQERIENYNKNPTKCFACNSIFSYESRNKKFCNHSCAAKINNLNRCLLLPKKPDCLSCNGSLGKNGSKYCSKRCQQDYQWKLRKEEISSSGKAGEIRQAKKYLKEVRGNSCEMCGIDTWAGEPILLICDHINGDSGDFNLINLRLICSNCDATTPFYKNKNMGNGRAYRRERYKLGKSF
jgi:hypothetical protein